MSKLRSKLNFPILILSLPLISIGLWPTIVVAQTLIPPCPLFAPLCQVVTYPDGTIYVGDIVDGKRNGQGTLIFIDGKRYVGQFRDGASNGQGVLTFPDGTKYVGEFRNVTAINRITGRGTLTAPDGSKYVGELKDGHYEGQGTYTYADGRTQSGIWKNDKLVNGTSGAPIGIPIEIVGSTFIVSVTINGKLTLDFTIDSGASDVAVPADVVMTLTRTGSITNADFLEEQQYQLADGSTVPSPTFIIRSLKVGNKVVENVRASVASVKGSLLLGQSFLNRFNSWSVDNKNRLLFLN